MYFFKIKSKINIRKPTNSKMILKKLIKALYENNHFI